MSNNHLLFTWLHTHLNFATRCPFFAKPSSFIVIHATLHFIYSIFQFSVLYVAQPSGLNAFKNLSLWFFEYLVLASYELIRFVCDVDADVHLIIYWYVIMNLFAVIEVLVELLNLVNIYLLRDRILFFKHFLQFRNLSSIQVKSFMQWNFLQFYQTFFCHSENSKDS